MSPTKPRPRQDRVLAVFTVVALAFLIGILFGQSCTDARIVMPELPLDSLVLTPDSVTVQPGDTVQFTATLWSGGAIVGCSGDCVSIPVNPALQQVFMALRNNRPVEIEIGLTPTGTPTVVVDGNPMRVAYAKEDREP